MYLPVTMSRTIFLKTLALYTGAQLSGLKFQGTEIFNEKIGPRTIFFRTIFPVTGHSGLLVKLESLSVSGNVFGCGLQLVVAYNNRRQLVSVNGHHSSILSRSGVPQGTVYY